MGKPPASLWESRPGGGRQVQTVSGGQRERARLQRREMGVGSGKGERDGEGDGDWEGLFLVQYVLYHTYPNQRKTREENAVTSVERMMSRRGNRGSQADRLYFTCAARTLGALSGWQMGRRLGRAVVIGRWRGLPLLRHFAAMAGSRADPSQGLPLS